MSYESNLEAEDIASGYLLVIEPRRYVTTWEIVTGTIYKASFDYGEVRSVRADDTDLELAASSSVGSDEFFFDVDTDELYIDVGGDPASVDVVAGYELYFGTEDAHFNRDPLDDTTRVVYFEPLLVETPEIVASVTDALFGYLPSSSGSIVLGNSEGQLARHLDSSFNSIPLSLYHWLESIEDGNLRTVYRGLVNSVSMSDDVVQLNVLDRNNIFDREYRHPSGINFFDETTFPAIDPNHKNRPARKVFGFVEGCIGINLNYSSAPGSAVNNEFGLHSGTSGLGTVTRVSAGTGTTTRTYFDIPFPDANGFQVDDDIYFIFSGETAIVTAVGADYIDHTAIAAPYDPLELVYRFYIGSCRVVMDGVTHRLTLGTEFDPANFSGVSGLELDQTAITSLAGRPFASGDLLYCRVYGETCSATLGGNPFGGDSETTGTLTQAVVLLWNLFRDVVGLEETEISTSSFTALQGTVADEFGYELPFKSGSDFPLMRDLVAKFCESLLLKVFIDSDSKWAIRQTGPLGAVAKTITDDEILFQKFVYAIEYQEVVSDIFVEYKASAVNQYGQVASDLSRLAVSSSSQVAKRLHRVVKQKTYQSLHFLEAEAQTLADRLKFYFGDRRGLLTISAKNRFFDTEIDDVIRVERELIPGEAFEQGTLRTKDFATSSTSKDLREIEITLDDQKGIEDNAGDW